MTETEAKKLMKTGKYLAGPIWCMWFDGEGNMHEDFSPGHPKWCNCDHWCKKLPEGGK